MGANGQAGMLLEAVFEHVSDAILIIDKEGYVVRANKAAEHLTGMSRTALCNRVLLCEICGGMSTCTQESTCADCFAQKSTVPSFAMMVRRADGEEVPVAASSTRLPDEGMGALVVILRDTSEQQRMERESFQRMMATHMIRAQEEERKRISRDLHDGVGQALYSILVGLKVVGGLELDETSRNLIAEVEQQTLKALDEVKAMSADLRPAALDDLGLVPAVRSYAKRFEQTFGIATRVDAVNFRRRLAQEVETALYRICQEAMLNAAKYADTDELAVRLVDAGGKVELTVIDQGVGFDPKAAQDGHRGLGLYGMKERASLLGGRMEILSAPGEGTTIHVTIPVNEKGEAIHVDPGAYRR